MLPDGSAFELPPKIAVYSNAPIIFFTAREQAEDKLRASRQVQMITSQSPIPSRSFLFVSTLTSDVT